MYNYNYYIDSIIHAAATHTPAAPNLHAGHNVAGSVVLCTIAIQFSSANGISDVVSLCACVCVCVCVCVWCVCVCLNTCMCIRAMHHKALLCMQDTHGCVHTCVHAVCVCLSTMHTQMDRKMPIRQLCPCAETVMTTTACSGPLPNVVHSSSNNYYGECNTDFIVIIPIVVAAYFKSGGTLLLHPMIRGEDGGMQEPKNKCP